MDMRWLIANGACGTHTKLYMKHVMSNKHVWNDNQAQNWPSFLIRLVTYSPFGILNHILWWPTQSKSPNWILYSHLNYNTEYNATSLGKIYNQRHNEPLQCIFRRSVTDILAISSWKLITVWWFQIFNWYSIGTLLHFFCYVSTNSDAATLWTFLTETNISPTPNDRQNVHAHILKTIHIINNMKHTTAPLGPEKPGVPGAPWGPWKKKLSPEG